MILEGLVTTLDADGTLNVAPMGPRVEPNSPRFILSPFPSSTTFRNLIRHGEGVLHVTDDVLLLARSAVGKVSDAPNRPAERVLGRVLLDACRYEEFRVTEIDRRDERARIACETVHRGRFRDFFGFNRARHAVLEAAILATRTHILPPDEVAADLARYRVIVDKTGGDRESQAFDLLAEYIRTASPIRTLEGEDRP